MKNAGAISWSDVESGEAALIARCATGDEAACAELVAAHQRMVYGLAFTSSAIATRRWTSRRRSSSGSSARSPTFRGQSALRTWIYRIVVNQARNRQRWWRRRHRADQVSLDDHLQQLWRPGSPRQDVLPDRLLASKETAAQHLAGARPAARSISARRSSCARSTGCATRRSPIRSTSRSAP